MAATIGGDIFLTSGSTFEVSAISVSAFAIESSTTAAATSSSTGNVRINFLLPVGTSAAVAGLGWNAGYYGQVDMVNQKQNRITIQPRQWTLDTWGEDL